MRILDKKYFHKKGVAHALQASERGGHKKFQG